MMSSSHRFRNIIGSSRTIKEVRIQMAEAIDSDTDLLVTGETGTGKELVAREIHYSTFRSSTIWAELRLIAVQAGPEEWKREY